MLCGLENSELLHLISGYLTLKELKMYFMLYILDCFFVGLIQVKFSVPEVELEVAASSNVTIYFR